MLIGDVNSDTKLNVLDLQMLYQYKNETLIDDESNPWSAREDNSINTFSANVYLDDTIDKKDLAVLHSYFTGIFKITELGKTEYENLEIPSYIGDVNGDESINTTDVVAIEEHINGTMQLTGEKILEADLDLNGKITEIDVILLELYLDNIEGFDKIYAVNLEKVLKHGDINSDGKVTSDDYAKLNDYLAGTVSLTNIETLSADVNCDGYITKADAVVLQRHLAEWTGYKKLPFKGMA